MKSPRHRQRCANQRESQILSMLALLVFAGTPVAPAHADTLLGNFEGNLAAPDFGFEVFDDCDPPHCSTRVENGAFIVQFGDMGDFVRFAFRVNDVDEEPPPTIWSEWRYRSNNPNPLNSLGCDATARLQYYGFADGYELWGDSAQSFGGVDRIDGLNLADFHTVRVEMRPDPDASMLERTYSIDGQLFPTRIVPLQSNVLTLVSLGGVGGCSMRPNPVVHEWDFVRWGTLTEGEKLVAVSPRGGLLPESDRFSVTFDQPHYAFVDDIAVESTEPVAPVVTRTWRIDGQDSNSFEIGLDRVVDVGETITVTIGDPADGNVVVLTGAEAGIPAASTWGLAGLTLGILTAATLVLMRARSITS